MKYTILILMIFTIVRCTSFQPLSLKQEMFSANNLKLNGYYYSFDDGVNKAFFLYGNGVFHDRIWDGIDSYYTNNLDSLDIEVSRIYEKEKKYPIRYSWGAFKVSNSNIKIERWLSGNGQAYPTQMLIGKILNDSTIHFSEKIGDNGVIKGKEKIVYNINETYHFRQLSPKPDSTNQYIK